MRHVPMWKLSGMPAPSARRPVRRTPTLSVGTSAGTPLHPFENPSQAQTVRAYYRVLSWADLPNVFQYVGRQLETGSLPDFCIDTSRRGARRVANLPTDCQISRYAVSSLNAT